MPRVKRAVTDLLRLQVAARDGVICQYCGDRTAPAYHVDHVVPFVLEGPCVLYNLVLACEACNARKNDAIWIPRNLDRITASRPEWRARVLALAAQQRIPRRRRVDDPARVQPADPLSTVHEWGVDFYGDTIPVVQTADGAQYVVLRPVAALLGLDWNGQYQRLKRDPILTAALTRCLTQTPGGPQALICLPLALLPGWLFGLRAERVRPDTHEKLTRYRRMCFDLLALALQTDRPSL